MSSAPVYQALKDAGLAKGTNSAPDSVSLSAILTASGTHTGKMIIFSDDFVGTFANGPVATGVKAFVFDGATSFTVTVTTGSYQVLS